MNVFQYDSATHNLPIDAVRAKVTHDRINANRFRIKGWAPENIINEPTTQLKELRKISWMIKHDYKQQDEAWIMQQVKEGHRLMIVSDGSYHPEYKMGTAAWVITTSNDTTRRIYADNTVPGHKYLQCPHRSELCGLV